MFQPDDKQTVEYLRRSYSAVDGLWFMKVEEKRGFEEALDSHQLESQIFIIQQGNVLGIVFVMFPVKIDESSQQLPLLFCTV